MNHPEIARCRSWYNIFRWPMCLMNFADLVGNGKPWDFKRTQKFTHGNCPRPALLAYCHLVRKNVLTMMYQGTSTMVGLDGLLRSAAGFCCMLLTELRRVELTTPRIRKRSKLEWICGIFRAREQTFAKRFLLK